MQRRLSIHYYISSPRIVKQTVRGVFVPVRRDCMSFQGVIGAASNLIQGSGAYTEEMFLTDFPQFTRKGSYPADCLVPRPVLGMFLENASQAVQPGRWFEKWRYASGLYVAHYATLYLRTWSEGSDTPAQAAASGATLGVVKAAVLGDTSVTYDNAALTAATEKWGGLNATQYGQMLATEARLVGMGGTLVI